MAKIVPIKAHPEITKPCMPLIEVTGNGNLLCYDETTGRWFRSSESFVRDTVRDINEFLKGNSLPIGLNATQLLDCLGLHHSNNAYQYGWRVEDLVPWNELYSVEIVNDNYHGMHEPVLVISASAPAVKNYMRSEEEIMCDDRI